MEVFVYVPFYAHRIQVKLASHANVNMTSKRLCIINLITKYIKVNKKIEIIRRERNESQPPGPVSQTKDGKVRQLLSFSKLSIIHGN